MQRTSKRLPNVETIVLEADPQAFVTAETCVLGGVVSGGLDLDL
jgi:hypothetical protein